MLQIFIKKQFINAPELTQQGISMVRYTKKVKANQRAFKRDYQFGI